MGVTFNHDNELYWGSTTRYNFSFSFLTHESKIKYDKYLTDPLGPFKRYCDTNHYKPIITVGVAFNHDNELYWGSTTRYRFLFSFLTQESKIKYENFLPTHLGPLKRDCDTNHCIPIFTVGVTFNYNNELYWGSTTRYNFSFSFLTHESKIKYDKYLTDPLGPIKRDCDTNHYKPIITVGVAFNHDNELYWGSTTRYRFLFSFLTKESKIKYDIIPYRPIWGPLRGIVTSTTVYQYLQ